ncbi:hypothetical protein D3C80_1367720 [compost metagenome]
MRGRRQRRRGQYWQLRQCLVERFHAAQAAAAGAGQLPALALERPEGAAADFHLGADGLAVVDQADVIDIVD